MGSLVPLSQLLSTLETGPGSARLQVGEDWLQGRTVFGGLQAAIGLAAMRTQVPGTPLRTLQGTFLSPVPGGTVTARAQVLRTGKSATHVEARLVDGDSTLALLVGVFGASRESRVVVRPTQPVVDGGGASPALPFIPGVTPAFTQHFVARWRRGLPPFTGDTGTEHVIDLELRDPAPIGEAAVLALADFIPPVALSHLKGPAPGSTLTWMLEFLGADLGALGGAGWRVDAQLQAAGEGYTSQSVMLWGPGGVPVALSRQSMVVFG